MARKFNINSKTITAPLAAFCMASILFVYARISIQAAKRNAQNHREADGGQISWRNESLRRHGALELPRHEESGVVGQLLLLGRKPSSATKGKDAGPTEKEEDGEEMHGLGRARTRARRMDEEERIRAAVMTRGKGRDAD